MKTVYPVTLTPTNEGLLVYIPDLDINTHGINLLSAIEMARDAISVWCVCHEDEGRELPKPSEISTVKHKKGEIVTLVDIDTTAYRKGTDTALMPAGA